MYGIAKIREDFYFWDNLLNEWKNEEEHFFAAGVIEELQEQFLGMERRIEADILEYEEQLSHIGKTFYRLRKYSIDARIKELKSLKYQVSERQRDLKKYESKRTLWRKASR